MEMIRKRALWGGETEKAVANFPVSGEPIPVPVARWLARIKAAAARVNAELGLLDEDKAARIASAADRVSEGEFDDQFPIDVFQTGSGTSSNMNANEVIAALAGDDVHPLDDVNMGQSSNDVFPSAVHLAALHQLANDLLPALSVLTCVEPLLARRIIESLVARISATKPRTPRCWASFIRRICSAVPRPQPCHSGVTMNAVSAMLVDGSMK